MNLADTITESESPKGNWHEKDAADHISSNRETPQQILKSALDALSRGRFAEVLSCFDDRFRYNDHSLDLEFTDKPRLTEFFEKARELFPDTTLEIVSLFESGRQATTNDFLVAHGLQEEPTAFDVRFSRCFHLLRFVACRILGSTERVHDAIECCWRTASRNPPRFKYEGAFRGWLLRVLIDEALAIRRKETKLSVKTVPQFVPAEEGWKLADCCLE